MQNQLPVCVLTYRSSLSDDCLLICDKNCYWRLCNTTSKCSTTTASSGLLVMVVRSI